MIKFCKKCGVETERNKKGDCKPCATKYGVAYRLANPEKVKTKNAACYAANGEKYRATSTAYRIANREKKVAYQAAYYVVNKEKAKAAAALYRITNPIPPEISRISSARYYAANKEKVNARGSIYRAKHPEKAAARGAAWAAKNPKRVLVVKAAWRAANPNKVKTSVATWRAKNPLASRIHQQNREARKRANGGVLSKDIDEKLIKLQRGKCACCGKPLGADFHLDHILPVDLGGPNIDSNIQLLRQRCNDQKSAKHPVDFMQSRGYLL